jgi:hypothetical protein
MLLVLMFLGIYGNVRTITQHNLAGVAQVAFTLFGTVASAYLFNLIYNDELQAKTLSSVVGRGNGRATIVLVKLLLNIILTAVIFTIAVLAFMLLLSLFGFEFRAANIVVICKNAGFVALRGIAISTIASIVLYGLQKGGLALATFMLMTVGFFTQIILFALNKLKLMELSHYMLNPIVANLIDGVTIETLFAYVLYVLIFTGLAIVVFKQKDLDF